MPELVSTTTTTTTMQHLSQDASRTDLIDNEKENTRIILTHINGKALMMTTSTHAVTQTQPVAPTPSVLAAAKELQLQLLLRIAIHRRPGQ